MVHRQRALASLALLGVMLVAAAVPVHAQEAPRSAVQPQPNVRVTIRLGRVEKGQRRVVKTYHLVVGPETKGSTLLSGARVPLPVGGDAADKAAFVYQNIGFSVVAEAFVLTDGRIRLQAELEDSRLLEPVAGRPPVVETRQLSVNAVLADGKPLEVTRVEGEVDPNGFVEVEAKVER